MEVLDRKFRINAVRMKELARPGEAANQPRVITESEAILFLAKDNAVPGMLRSYLAECSRLGAGEDQIHAVKLMIDRVDQWRRENTDLCKIPDVDAGKELENVCKPNEK